MRPASDGEESGRQLRRWGPIVGVVVVLLVVIVVVALAGGDDDDGDEATTEGTATGGSDDEGSGPGAPEPMGRMPITYEEAVEAGTVDDYEWGDRCDLETGQLAIPTIYASPCVPLFEGDNGGATYRGVTDDTITVVSYDGDDSGDLTALLGGEGLEETDEDQVQTMEDYFEALGALSETYGRDVEVVFFKGTGAAQDEVAARADAIQIAEEIEPFIVIGGPNLDGGAFAEELSSRGILCTGCVLGVPDCIVQDHAPYNWGGGATSAQFNKVIAAWLQVGDEDGFTNEAAEYAGDPEFTDQPRRFGLIHFEQDPPVYADCPFEGWPEGIVVEPYVLDLATAPETALDLIAKMKDEDVTTVIFQGDPYMPIYLTGAATDLEYRPEWIFTGTVLTDTNVFGRQYDQSQMAHAFGLAQNAVPLPQELQTSWSLYQWYFGEDAEPPAPSQYGVISPAVSRVLNGIHMAGPELTPETFEKGMFRRPPRGGGATKVQVSYGNWGLFDDPDYFGTDDMTAIWWDPEATGVDEIGRDGVGMWRFVDGGQRFTALDPTLPNPFIVEGSVISYDTLPPGDEAPSYPPPPGSPAAG